jgi:uncharacterized LabA/DUF88 family protein
MRSSVRPFIARIMNRFRRTDRIGVFIDCDGVSPKDAARALGVVASHGRVRLVRSYGNTGGRGASAWAYFSSRYDADARHFPNLTSGKNTTDIALTVDAVEALLTIPIDVFVLIASDADFVPLAHRIRAEGKMVFGFGQESAPQAFRTACDKFWDIKSLTQQRASVTLSAPHWTLAPSDAEDVVVSVLREVAPGGTPVTIDMLGQALAAQWGFDPRIFSRRSLSDLLRDLPSVEVFELGGKRVVRLAKRQG